MASPAVLSSIYSNTLPTFFKSHSEVVDAFTRGPLLKLPAGSLDAVVGAEYNRSSVERGFDADRTAKALFTELRAPLIAATDGRDAKRELLAVQGAVRYDNYSDFGSQTTWQAGLEFRPSEAVLLRGTHATAFKPPTLFNLAFPTSTGTTAVTDPQRNGETVVRPVQVRRQSGPEPDDRKRRPRSASCGLPPSSGPQMRDATWWKLDIDNAISVPASQFVVNNEANYRGGSCATCRARCRGKITSVDTSSFVNFGALHEQGVDAASMRGSDAVRHLHPRLSPRPHILKFDGASTRPARHRSTGPRTPTTTGS
jgi:iron complex outermembrane receptor protein